MTIKEIHQRLASLGAAPSRSLGQNFLFDQNLAKWIVAQLEIQPGDHVVEIGPGLGALTELLAEVATSLTIIEKDDRLIPWLRERYAGKHVEIIHTDAVSFDTRRLLGRGPLRIIGNLPYYVSTPLIDRFANPVLAPKKLVFTLQKELADRLNATPGTKAYGAMTLCLGRRWAVRSVKTLPPTVFFPAPKVDSAVVTLDPRPASDVPVADDQLFDALVRAGFSERRKQLRKLLPEVTPERWTALAGLLGIPHDVRGEALTRMQWTALVQELAPSSAQKAEEIFDIVDECDVVVDSKPRGEVHAQDLRHRAVHVMLFNRDGEIFLQKRSIWKDKNPALWDSSSAGHVDSGEDYETAAHREMLEEIGIDTTITTVCKLGCGPETGFEFLQIYHGEHDGPFTFAPTEVEGGSYFPVDQVTRWLSTHPSDFTPIFRQAFPLVIAARAARATTAHP
jgi:16S rRNA (adenine1518-N6/adenine1519-N6)-dimethyltransferase